MSAWRNGVEWAPSAGSPQPVGRSMEEQEHILTVICPACPHGLWKGDHCAACAGAGCFSSRIAHSNQHCPKGEW